MSAWKRSEFGYTSADGRVFIEQHEALEAALDAYEELKETERYDGKTDDLESAWDEVTSSLEALADAAEVLELSS
jgi:hypothetical protein